MATIAQLATIFTVDNSQFKAGLRDSEKRARKSSRTIVGHTRRMAKGFRGAVASVTSYRSALALLAGGTAMALVIKREMEAIDETAKFSRTLGVATEDLISYRHAASLAGVEQKVMDSSMTALIKRLGETRAGTGQMITFFKKYDKTILENIKTQENAAGAMEVVGDAIMNARNEADAAAIANAAFGRQGVKMAEIFREDGAGALKAARAEAEKLGITFSAFDAAQVERANDEIERMQKSFKGVATRLAIDVAPFVTAVTQKITEMQTESDALFNAFTTGGKAAVTVLGWIADGAHTIRIGFVALKVVGNGLWSVVLNLASAFLNFIADIVDLPNKLNPLIEKLNQIPGVNVPLFGAVDRTGFIADIDAMAEASVSAIRDSKDELHNLMMEPLPSQAINNFISGVQSKVEQARAQVTGGGDIEAQIEANTRQQEIEAEHQRKMNQIASQGQSQLLGRYTSFLDSMKTAADQSGAAQVNTLSNAFAQITAAGATENKKLFKLNKAAAIGNALVSTYQGMAKALEWGYPMGPIFAAVIGAAGFAQVQSIRSQSFQGGGGGVAPSVGPTPAPPVTPVSASGETEGEQRQVVENRIIISGLDDRQYLTDVLEPMIKKRVEEDDAVLITANSAQAGEIARANR